MIQHTVLRVMAKLLIPLIMVFGLYVQFHGDYGPGGGFQAGVIMAAGYVLFALVFGLPEANRVIPPRVLEILIALGVLVYGSVGVITMLMGGNFLEYDLLGHDAEKGQHRGIFYVELGVGITVTAVMIKLFLMFAGRRELRGTDEA